MFMFSEAMPLLDNVASFSVAGLMGAMWLWERRNSQTRERQIDEAHQRILSDRVQLNELMQVVRQNAEAVSRLGAAQEQLLRQIAAAVGGKS